MNQRDGLAACFEGMADGVADEALCAEDGDGDLMPTPESARTCFLVLESRSLFRKSISRAASGELLLELDAGVHERPCRPDTA